MTVLKSLKSGNFAELECLQYSVTRIEKDSTAILVSRSELADWIVPCIAGIRCVVAVCGSDFELSAANKFKAALRVLVDMGSLLVICSSEVLPRKPRSESIHFENSL